MDLSLYLHFAGLRLRERMEYRVAYLFGIVGQILGYGAEYAVIFLLLNRFQSIDGWTFPEIALLFSLNIFSYALGAAFAFSPMVELEQMVVQGNFETILTRPLNPLLHLSARKYNVGYVAHVILAGAFLVWSVGLLGAGWGPLSFVYLALAIAGAACLQAAGLIAVGALSFFFVRSSFAFNLYFTLRGFVSYPLTVYGAGIQWLLTLVFPLAFINFYPAALLLGRDGAVLPAVAGLAAPLVGPVALYLAYRFFLAGVGRYQGAGG